MTAPGPNVSFVLTLFSFLAIYAELIWPGRRLAGVVGPGVLGVGGACAGVYFLWLQRPTALGLGLLGLALALFLIDAVLDSYFLAGFGATVAMAVGCWKLFDYPPGIVAGMAFPLCLIFGSATMLLNHSAKQARRNKRLGTFPKP